MKGDLEIRTWAECRIEPAEGGRLRGYAIRFNVRSLDLGGFQEVIAPEAVDRAIREASDVRALIDHDTGKVLARTSAGTLQLRKDQKGLKVEIDADPEISYARDIVRAVGRGDVSGMSFAFRTIEDRWEWDEDPILRTVLDMELREVSIVTFPAYPQTDVSVAQRSLEVARQSIGPNRLAWLQRWHKTRVA